MGGRGAASGDVRVASDERDWGQCVGQRLLLSRSCAFLNPQDRFMSVSHTYWSKKISLSTGAVKRKMKL